MLIMPLSSLSIRLAIANLQQHECFHGRLLRYSAKLSYTNTTLALVLLIWTLALSVQ